jgi:L,D-peptidoglycan transpeptidase YkuD (ErfK/YbiS/YcfS/YnhG family)
MPATPSPLAGSRQLIRVLAADWQSTTAQLQRFARNRADAEWQPVGAAIPVTLGRSGLAWGLGLHPASAHAAACKREGDGCAPAGIFALTALFGTADPESQLAQSAGLPYRCATGDLKCVDDPASRHYNQIVDQSQVAEIDWTSCEDMRRPDTRYAIGAVVAHNPAHRPGAGSCIFLHVWQDAATPTAGCTAAALAEMTTVCTWLDAVARPLLVQLPQAEYDRHRQTWALP